MKFSEAPRTDFKQFSAFSKAFTDQNQFADFLQRPLNTVADLQAQAEEKRGLYPAENRRVLTAVLQQQLGEIASPSQLQNLGLLQQEDTVTITTGHQLTVFGGPLYLVYKVMHVVKLAEQFNAASEKGKAVPVFWMASEDHDHEEISTAYLFNQTLKWETEQTGAVGRMGTSDFLPVLEQLTALFEGKETEIKELLELPVDENYGHYMQVFLTKLFADYGVIVIQPDSAELKRLFLPSILSEMASDSAFQAVEAMNTRLQEKGFAPQATARACNLFLLKEGKRARIDVAEKGFAIDGEIYTPEALATLAEEHPEAFSPNVILRPVYQETILPNICYVGGGGEMAYWVQLKGVFETKGILCPIIAQRNSVILLDGNSEKKMTSMELDWKDFSGDKEALKKRMLQLWNGEETDFSEITAALDVLKERMVEKAAATDKSLESFAEAEIVRLQKQLENFEQRVIKQVKQKSEVQLKQLDTIAEKLFPSNSLQERHYHWLHFAPGGNYLTLFQAIYEGMEPLNGNFLAIRC